MEKKLEISKRKLHQGYEQAEKGELVLNSAISSVAWMSCRKRTVTKFCVLTRIFSAKRQRTVQVLDIPDLPKDRQVVTLRGSKGNRPGNAKAGILNRNVKPTRR